MNRSIFASILSIVFCSSLVASSNDLPEVKKLINTIGVLVGINPPPVTTFGRLMNAASTVYTAGTYVYSAYETYQTVQPLLTTAASATSKGLDLANNKIGSEFQKKYDEEKKRLEDWAKAESDRAWRAQLEANARASKAELELHCSKVTPNPDSPRTKAKAALDGLSIPVLQTLVDQGQGVYFRTLLDQKLEEQRKKEALESPRTKAMKAVSGMSTSMLQSLAEQEKGSSNGSYFQDAFTARLEIDSHVHNNSNRSVLPPSPIAIRIATGSPVFFGSNNGNQTTPVTPPSPRSPRTGHDDTV